MKKGYKFSEEHKQKISLAHLGKKVSEETREKIRLANKGKKRSEDFKYKMSLIRIGKPHPHKSKSLTEETKKKISEKLKGRIVPRWQIEKMALINKGNKYTLGFKQSEKTKIILSNIMKGKNNPNWKHGLANINKTERQILMNGLEYKNWRIAVLKRDDYRCIDCGEIKKGQTEVNHILSWKDYPRLRYEIHNGETLCESCHLVKTIAQSKGTTKLEYIFN